MQIPDDFELEADRSGAIMPAIAVKNAVVFPIPSLPVPLAVGRARTMKAIERAADGSGLLFVVTQRDPTVETPGESDLYTYGTIARILRLTQSVEDAHELLIEGIGRGKIVRFTADGDYLEVEAVDVAEQPAFDVEGDALVRSLKEMTRKVIRLSPRLPEEALTIIEGIDHPSHLADLIASQMRLGLGDKQLLLEEANVKARLGKVLEHLAHEAAVLEITGKIHTEVRQSLDRHQREVLLREQLRAIRKELGDDAIADDVDELERRVQEAKLPPLVRKAAARELRRLEQMSPQGSEYTVARTYVEWLLDLPWGHHSADNLDIRGAAELLDNEHYGLQKVKRRITEYLAVRKLKGDMKGPILCLVGPPGVGKTSLGKSIANALGRKFTRISLGGVRDEAEIRGHRRTYVGAMPGRFVKALKRAGTMNPVILLDEIDKVGSDFRGDPSSALLEVLDPEQNDSFTDHYLEVPIDLSGVMFMTTANRLDTIPPPLRDRMEIIQIPSYIEEEKLAIARRHLLPQELVEHGLDAGQVEVTEEALHRIISHYTKEAGVRGLRRQIAAVLRSVARDVVLELTELPEIVDGVRVRAALGPQRVFPEVTDDVSTPGVAIGLAWTPVGGEILFIESTVMKGVGKLKLTGQVGDVMTESAHAAVSFIHARADQLGLKETLFSSRNIHLHLPSGGIPKDGPSAGVTIVVALTSLLTGHTVRPGVAMTGEITLRGMVLPVGGIKEKVIAAHRAGIREIIMPKRNEGDLEEIPAHLRDELVFHFVERVEEALRYALGVMIGSRPQVLLPRVETLPPALA